MPAALPNRTFRFGAFEVDRRSGELRKRGLKIKLQDQPVRILLLLLEHPGEIVSRGKIRDSLWPENTFVDFENAISSAVRKAREALNDNPDNPRFIETVARQGYRFICPAYQSNEDEDKSVLAYPAAEQISSSPKASETQDAEKVANVIPPSRITPSQMVPPGPLVHGPAIAAPQTAEGVHETQLDVNVKSDQIRSHRDKCKPYLVIEPTDTDCCRPLSRSQVTLDLNSDIPLSRLHLLAALPERALLPSQESS